MTWGWNQGAAIAHLTDRGFRVRPGAGHDELWVCCPFCELNQRTPDTEYKLGVNIRTGEGHCFRCEWKTGRGAMRKLGVVEFMVQDELEEEKEKIQEFDLPEDFERLQPGQGDWMGKAWNFVRKRGVTAGQIRYYKIGLSLSGRYAYRVVVPVYKHLEVVGCSARSIVNKEPKWLHSEGLNIMFKAAWSGRDTVLLTEGMFDAMSVARDMGRQMDVAAILGHSLTERKLGELEGHKRVVLWLDPDRAGGEGTLKIMEELGDVEKYVIRWQREPGDCTAGGEILMAWRHKRRWTWEESQKVAMEGWGG